MSFDTLAPHHRWMEALTAGNKLQRCRTVFLDQVAPSRDVLILGEGNGRFLLECCRRFETARVTCVDASARMLTLARQRLERHGAHLDRIQFVHADVLAWTPPLQTFDLVVTHFFLDCFRPEQLERVVSTLASAAAPAANWLLADFQVPSAGWRRYRALLIHRLMYLFFRVVTGLPAQRLTAPDALLSAHRFSLRARQTREWGLLHTDLWTREAD